MAVFEDGVFKEVMMLKCGWALINMTSVLIGRQDWDKDGGQLCKDAGGRPQLQAKKKPTSLTCSWTSSLQDHEKINVSRLKPPVCSAVMAAVAD